MLFFDKPQTSPGLSSRGPQQRAVAIQARDRRGTLSRSKRLDCFGGPRCGPSRNDNHGRKKAFTLLELLVVIAVVAVLSGIVLGVGRRAAESGRNARARAELSLLSAALDSYKLTHGDFPRTDVPARLLQSLIGKRGPTYLPATGRALIESAKFTTTGGLDLFSDETAELLDPWGQPYRYTYKSQVPWTNPSCVLYSAGPDGSDTAALLRGGFLDTAAAGNADNLQANQP